MRITHKVDYAVRALTAMARDGAVPGGTPVTRERLSEGEAIPPAFLDDILRALRNGALVHSQRGADGGWRLASPPERITVADIIRVVEGPLAAVRGIRPHELEHDGADPTQARLWVAVRASLRAVLEHVTVADLAASRLPPSVEALLDDPDAFSAR